MEYSRNAWKSSRRNDRARSVLTRISHEWGTLGLGFPVCSTSRCRHASEIGVFYRDARDIACRLLSRHSTNRTRRCGATRRRVPSSEKPALEAPFSFPFFFLTVPLLLFIVNVFQRDSTRYTCRVSAAENCDTRACTPIFCGKLVANTNYYLSRQIQAAVPLQLINFRVIRSLFGLFRV